MRNLRKKARKKSMQMTNKQNDIKELALFSKVMKRNTEE